MTDVCFIGGSQSFIDRDRDLLEYLGYRVHQHSYGDSYLSYCREVKQAVKKSDVVYGWFASWETLPGVWYARRYGIPSIIVIGGYDAACCPEINYGAWSNWKERQAARYVCNHANILLPVSKFTRRDLLSYVSLSGIVELIYNGVDVDKFTYGDSKRDMAICVGEIKQNNLIRKGQKMFVRVAAYLPDVDFYMVGDYSDSSVLELKGIASDNVTFTGYVSNEKLIELYQKASVVCQFSFYEAFGMAPIEGMACGCTPVVTSERTGMPEFVDDSGYYTQYGDVEDATKKIGMALQDDGERARKQAKKFTLERRKRELSNVLEELLMEYE